MAQLFCRDLVNANTKVRYANDNFLLYELYTRFILIEQ